MAPDPVFPPLPANLDTLQRADLVVLCDQRSLLVKRTETAAALRARLRRCHETVALHQRNVVRSAAEAEYRKRVPAPERNPALDVVRAGLWGLANLASALEQDGQIAQTLYYALPVLAGYVRGTGGFTREEAESMLVAVEESLRYRKYADPDDVSSRIAHCLGDVARAHNHHDGIVEARRAARKAEAEARKAASAQ